MCGILSRSAATPLSLLAAALVLPAAAMAQEEPADDSLAPLSAAAITFEERVVEIVNQERAAAGVPPLKGVSELLATAGGHAENMAVRDFFDHCDLDTKESPFDRMEAAGYAWDAAAENIAAEYSTPEDVMAAWMASPEHRAFILDENFESREIGVGHFQQADDQQTVGRDFSDPRDCDADDFGEAVHGPYYHYWTQSFGRRNGVYPLVINRESHDTVCSALQLYVYGPPNATQMRFKIDGGSWSAWMPYSPQATLTLPGASGSQATVFSEVTNGSTTFPAQDEIVLGSGFPATSTVNVPQQTVSTTETFEACDTVSATSGFEVAAGGDVTFQAGRRIVLGDGFSVASGATFRAVVDPSL